jgi:beta-mannosidase
VAALHHRASRPFTMGSLYWQLNDVWPGASWSSVDWFGRWKALQFHARRFYAPVAVAALRRPDGNTVVSLLNDRTRPVRGVLRLRVMELGGKLLRDERTPVELAPLSAAKVADYTDAALLGNADPASTVAVFDLAAEREPASRGVVYFKAAKDMAWPAPALDAQLRPDGDGDGDGYALDLHAATLARAVWVDFGDADAELSDNALTLLPGESLSLHVASRAPLATLRKALRVRTVAGIPMFTKTR